MLQNTLTKEEQKAIKAGYAYRKWRRCQLLTLFITFAWIFGGMPLAHINSVTQAIYSIVMLIIIVIEFRMFILSCWKCPMCNGKLPSKSAIGGTATVLLPVLVKECPYCGADLREKKR